MGLMVNAIFPFIFSAFILFFFLAVFIGISSICPLFSTCAMHLFSRERKEEENNGRLVLEIPPWADTNPLILALRAT